MHIREQIQRIAGTFGIDLVQKLTCTVNSVDVDHRSCLVTPQNRNIGQLTAFLMAETDDGILIVPSENSTVKVLYSRLNAATVIQYSAIDQVFIVAGGSTFNIYSSGIKLNGSNYYGLVMIKPLITKINNLEKLVNAVNDNWNNFAAVYKPGSPSTTGLPAALNVLPFTTPTDINPVTQQSDLENTAVQHGDGS